MKELKSKQRAYLMKLASSLEPIFQIGKSSLTPECTAAIAEAFNTRELIKISVLKNCFDDPREIAAIVAERTHSTVVQVIGKKIVLEDYSLRALTDGEDAQSEAIVKIRVDGSNEVVTGRGVSVDVMEASIKAYINGINKYFND